MCLFIYVVSFDEYFWLQGKPYRTHTHTHASINIQMYVDTRDQVISSVKTPSILLARLQVMSLYGIHLFSLENNIFHSYQF